MLKQILGNNRSKSLKVQKYTNKNNNNEYNNKVFEENEKAKINTFNNKSEILNKKNNGKIENPSIIKKFFNTSNGFTEENYNIRKNYNRKIYNFLSEEELNTKMFKTLINDNNINLLNNNINKIMLQNNGNNNQNTKILKSIKIIKCEKLKSYNNSNPNNKKLFSNSNKKTNYMNSQLKENKEINQISTPKYKIKSIKNINYQNKNNNNKNSNKSIKYIKKNKKFHYLKNQISSSSSQSNKKNQFIKNHSTVFISQINNPIINYLSSNSIKKKSSNNISKIGLTKTRQFSNNINNKDNPGEKYIIKNKTYLDNSDILQLINIENNLNKNKFNKIKQNQNNRVNELTTSNKIIETIEINENKDDEKVTKAISENKTNKYKKIIKEDDCLINKPKIYMVKNSPNCKSNSNAGKQILTKENINTSKNEKQNIGTFNIKLDYLKEYLLKNDNEKIKRYLMNKKIKNSFQKKIITKNSNNNERNDETFSYSKNIINTDIKINNKNKEFNKILYNKSDSANRITENENKKNTEMNININSYEKNNKNKTIMLKINKKDINILSFTQRLDDGIKNKTLDNSNNYTIKNVNKKEENIKNKDISDFQNNKRNDINKEMEINNYNINLQNKIGKIVYNLNNNIKNKIKSKYFNFNNNAKIINNNINKNKINSNPEEEIKYNINNNIIKKVNNQLKENKTNHHRSYIKQLKQIKSNNNISKYDNNLNKTEKLKNIENLILNNNYNSINMNINNVYESSKTSNYINISNSKNTNCKKGINNSFNKSDIKSITKINFDMPINLDLDKIVTEDSKEENINPSYNLEKKIKTEIYKKENSHQSVSESQNTYKTSKIEKLENFINKLNGEDEGMLLKNDKIVLFNNEIPGYGKSVAEIELSNGCNDENNDSSKNAYLKNKNNIKSIIQNNTEIFEYKKNIFLNMELNKEINMFKENSDLYRFENKSNAVESEKKDKNIIKENGFYDDIKITDGIKNENNSKCDIKDCYNGQKLNIMDINIISPNNPQDSNNNIELNQKDKIDPSIIEGKDNGGNIDSTKEPISEYEFNINEGKFFKPLTKYEDRFNIDKINPF